MARKAASGTGTIRKKTITRNGKEYTYWEGRYTEGVNPGTGKQIQRSVTGKTQKEVAQKLKAVTASLDSGTYIAPQKMTVGEWLDIWAKDYLGNVKVSTSAAYRSNISLYIKPAIGYIKLSDLHPHVVQTFINGIDRSPATVQLAHRTLHRALCVAARLGYIAKNPADNCILPRQTSQEIKPLNDSQVKLFLSAINGTPYETLYRLALFTGLRQSELLGLTWDCVDFRKGTILVDKQLLLKEYRKENSIFTSPKSGKCRTVSPAPLVMDALRVHKRRMAEIQLAAGGMWNNTNNLLFTNEFGSPLEHWTIKRNFKSILDSIGLNGVRFHDLRHTYAVNAIRAGDDIKTIQGNLGHSSAAFTLDRYGHFTEQMREDSAARMNKFMKAALNL